jgi:transcriptional regulator with XRE-family HTH domain
MSIFTGQGIYMPAHPYDAKKVGKRLELIRVTLDLGSQSEFADRLHVTRGRMNNWVQGVALLPVMYAAKLRSQTGVTLDFIYCGDTSSLPLRLSELAQAAAASGL